LFRFQRHLLGVLVVELVQDVCTENAVTDSCKHVM